MEEEDSARVKWDASYVDDGAWKDKFWVYYEFWGTKQGVC